MKGKVSVNGSFVTVALGVFLIGVLCCTPTLLADVIHLKDGSTISGKIESIGPEEVVICSPNPVKIRMEMVEKITYGDVSEEIKPEAGETRPEVGMNAYLQGKINGERDAKGNPLWALAGLGCGIFGAGAAYFLKPSPPTHALIGKSANYVLGYTEGYQNKARNQNTMYACGGWLAFVAIYAAMGGFETTY